jgi:hypothetical protein
MSETNGSNTESFDSYVSVTAPGPTGPSDLTQENWERERERGGQKKDFKNCALQFSHHDLYHLLKFIEERAIRADSYAEVRQAVLFSEMIRRQAREQGF